MESQKPLLITDTQSSPHWKALSRTRWRSYIAIPILLQNQVLGLIRLNGKNSEQFDHTHIRRLEPLAHAAAIALGNAQLLEKTQYQATQLQTLQHITQDLTVLQDLDTLLQKIITHALHLLDTDAGGIYLYRPEYNHLEWTIAVNADTLMLGDTLEYGEGFPGHVWATGKAQKIDNYKNWEGKTEKCPALPVAIMGVPIQHGEEFLGVLITRANEKRGTFNEEELILLAQLATHAGIAIHNTHLYAQAQADIAERQRADIERERLLEEIQERALQMQQLMDTVPEGVVLLDTDQHILIATPLGQQALATLSDTAAPHPLTHLNQRPLATYLTPPESGRWHQVDAGSQHYEIVARPLDTGLTPKGWVLVLRDVTEERHLQKQQAQQERLAAIGQLAAGIAHDFNNIMSVIVLYAQVSMRTPNLASNIRERLAIMIEQTHRATNLIRQILDFSRRSTPEQQNFDLVPIFKEEIKLLERTLPANITLQLHYQANDYIINADLTRIQQVIMNLAINARDAMPDGGCLSFNLSHITLPGPHTEPFTEMAAGEWIHLSIHDTGIGIPLHIQPYIFDPFFSTKVPDKGTGLGLMQVRTIVQQYHGHITLTSTAEHGTTFDLYFPAVAATSAQQLPSESQTLPVGHGQTILLVEDNAATRVALCSALELLNYQVIEAANGQAAITEFTQHQSTIALILTDWIMPQMGGRALIHALHNLPGAPPIIVLTSSARPDTALAQIHTAGWFPKPVNLGQLARMLAKHLS